VIFSVTFVRKNMKPEVGSAQLFGCLVIFAVAFVGFVLMLPGNETAFAVFLAVLSIVAVSLLQLNTCDMLSLVATYVAIAVAISVLMILCERKGICKFNASGIPMWWPFAGGLLALGVVTSERTMTCITVTCKKILK
jgi:hypothetical protein